MDDILEEDFIPPIRLILGSAVAAKIRDGLPRATLTERAGLGAPNASSIEVGGLLMGESVGENTFRVLEASLATGMAQSFYLDPSVHQPCLDKFYLRYPDRNRFNLLGDWHFHPSGNLVPSPQDLKSLKETMADPTFQASFKVMLIVGLGADEQLRAAGVLLNREPKVLSGIEVTIVDDLRGE